MTPQAMARKTGIPLEIFEAGIPILEAVDTESRHHVDGGRRIIRLHDTRSWGWQVVNKSHYRRLKSTEDRRAYQREWIKERRARGKPSTKPVDAVDLSTNLSTPEVDTHRRLSTPVDLSTVSRQAEAEAETEEKENSSSSAGAREATPEPETPEEISRSALLKRFPAEFWGDVGAALGSSRNPAALSRTLVALLDGMPGHGGPFSPVHLGQGLRDLLLIGGELTGLRLDRFARRAAKGLPAIDRAELDGEAEDEYTAAVRKIKLERGIPT